VHGIQAPGPDRGKDRQLISGKVVVINTCSKRANPNCSLSRMTSRAITIRLPEPKANMVSM
jgi:hypothetical protein